MLNQRMFAPLVVDDFHSCLKWSFFLDFPTTPFTLEGGF